MSHHSNVPSDQTLFSSSQSPGCVVSTWVSRLGQCPSQNAIRSALQGVVRARRSRRTHSETRLSVTRNFILNWRGPEGAGGVLATARYPSLWDKNLRPATRQNDEKSHHSRCDVEFPKHADLICGAVVSGFCSGLPGAVWLRRNVTRTACQALANGPLERERGAGLRVGDGLRRLPNGCQ